MKKICLAGLLIFVWFAGCQNMPMEDTEKETTEISDNMIGSEENVADLMQEELPDQAAEDVAPLYQGDKILYSNRRIIGISEDGGLTEIFRGEISGEVVSGNGTLFFYKKYTTGGAWSGDGEPYQEHTEVIALPLDGSEPYILMSLNEYETLYLDFYEDTLYIADSDTGIWYCQKNEEGIYEPAEGSGSFVFVNDLGYSQFLYDNNDNLFLRMSKPSECNGRVLLWNKEEKSAGVFDCDGNLLYTYEDAESANGLRLLSERYLLKQSDDGTYLYDFESQTEKRICDDTHISHVMLQDTKIYYKTLVEVDPYQMKYGDDLVTYYCYDIDKGETAELFETVMQSCYPSGVDYPYFIYDGIIYYVDYEPEELIFKWMKRDLTEQEAAAEELGLTEYQDGFPEYGSMNTEITYTVCPDCGMTVRLERKDEFQFYDWIPSADKMNEFLASEEDDFIGQHDESDLTWHDCDSTYANAIWYFWSLNSVIKISDHYYSLEYRPSTYTRGAAHPSRWWQHYLLDTATGENVTIADLYAGTEEELKQIVAEQAVTIYQNTGSSRGQLDSEEEVYQDIYDHTYFGKGIQFCENGVRFFYSDAYAVGSRFEILVPYEKLGLDYLYGD